MYHEKRSADTEIAREFARKLKKKLGNNFKKAILFGSRAKGISRTDSDYDLLLVLHNRRMALPTPFMAEIKKTGIDL